MVKTFLDIPAHASSCQKAAVRIERCYWLVSAIEMLAISSAIGGDKGSPYYEEPYNAEEMALAIQAVAQSALAEIGAIQETAEDTEFVLTPDVKDMLHKLLEKCRP